MVERVNILGVGVGAVNLDTAMEIIDGWIARREKQYATLTNVHCVMECQASEEVRRVHNNAGLVNPDGVPLVWVCRLLGHANVGRVYGPDLLEAMCAKSAETGYRHFFYGGAEGVAQHLGNELQRRYPGLAVAGAHSPPLRGFGEMEEDAVIEAINATGPDIVWVGLGAPKQEQWMADHRHRLSAPALIGVGAAFDFLTGRKPQAPRFMQRSGTEWIFRLCTEPRRLWLRYLKYNPLFVLLVLAQILGLKRYERDW